MPGAASTAEATARGRRLTARDVPPRASAAAQREFEELLASLPDSDELFDRTVAHFAEWVPRERSGEVVARRVQAALDERRPASFVRLGDGEGAVLAVALGRYPALTEYTAAFVGDRHLGSAAALTDADPDLLERYRASVLNAEAVGIPNPHSLPMLLKMTDRPRSPFGIISIFEYFDELGRQGLLRDVVAVSSGFHKGLLDTLPAVIAGRDVVLVSCHTALGPAVRDRLGARSVTVLPVPLQGSLRPAEEVGPTGHYPERYRELLAELGDVGPGKLVLVAAGVLAEVYCEAARQAGSVAVDVGSIVDIWAGVRTRVIGQQDELFQRHQLV